LLEHVVKLKLYTLADNTVFSC